MDKKTTINATVLPIQGRQLPADWAKKAAQNQGGNFDRRDLENMWRQPLKANMPSDSPMHSARLKPPSWGEMFGQK
jgi:hypothetical protein